VPLRVREVVAVELGHHLAPPLRPLAGQRPQQPAAVTITSASSTLDKNDATWIVRPGVADSSCVSFESKNYPGYDIRHYDSTVYIANDGGTSHPGTPRRCGPTTPPGR
jgi:hypothetical protein